ncbi:Pantothenate_kinase 4 [Hexamita inflata]|uniref:Pantothenate kinase 4 n=1 Tax=Hexamita inflata TaxID=28002 RepID=A0AA86TSZ0_9EUKA|nr:Pantothenate kinase 4 [Hexamita inflata]CAI9968434.1 Pantothenate kinase 4 [Hexamita inflata]
MKNVLQSFLSPLCYLNSFRYSKIKATPINSPSTRFKAASRHLYNQLTEMLIEDCPLVSLDLGGTLTKMTVYIPDSQKSRVILTSKYSQFYRPELSFRAECVMGTYLFFVFHNSQIQFVIDFLNETGFPFDRKRVLRTTGGGAYKFKSLLVSQTNYNNLEIHDEIASLRSGMLFLTALKIKNETQKINQKQEEVHHNDSPFEELNFFDQVPPHSKNGNRNRKNVPRNWIYPVLFVQIGSGISFVKMDAEDYERVDGSAVGGATFNGLSQLILGQDLEYQELLKLGQSGKDKTTLTVGDIYGKNYANLISDLPAAFFGKPQHNERKDLVYGLNQMICVNVAHIAVLNAKQHGLKRIIFSGGFVTQFAEEQLDFGVKFYSGGTIECIFLRHDCVVGSIGAMLGKEVEYQEVQDKIGKGIENIVNNLEEITESEIMNAEVVFE